VHTNCGTQKVFFNIVYDGSTIENYVENPQNTICQKGGYYQIVSSLLENSILPSGIKNK